MAVVLQGLGPDSAACISRYRSLCSEQDFEAVKNFLNELIRQDQEKFLLLIITSKAARIPDKSLEYDIFEYLYGSHQLPLYLRAYANTRCCYKVSNEPDQVRACRYLQRGYELLHWRQACGSSDNSKRDRMHLGFSIMLAMLHAQLTHHQWKDAHALSDGAVGEIRRFPTDTTVTGAYYGTCTRIARIIGIQYILDIAIDHSLERATRSAAILREAFAIAFKQADLNPVRFEEFTSSLSIYKSVIESQARAKTPEISIRELVETCILLKQRQRKKISNKLGRKWLSGGIASA